MLCALCLSVFRENKKEWTYSDGVSHIQRAAKAGCKICCGLVEPTRHSQGELTGCFEYISPTWGLVNAELVIEIKDADDKVSYGFFRLVRMVDVQLPDGYRDYLESARLDSESQPWRVRPDGFEKPVPKSTGNQKVAEVAVQWLNSCLSSHPECSSASHGRSPPRYPKRLIDIRSSKPRLIMANQECLDGPYATLSHCWGKCPKFFTLTKANTESLRCKIPVKSLPRTFQDAMTVTRRLGVNYLWIDSLCIVQDSREDWLEQAQDMEFVYEHGVVNISVDHAHNPHEGIFKPRDINSVQGCYVLYSPSNEGESIWAVFDEHGDTFYERGSPIRQRAWVFQERMLAPRILHFGTNSIFWECKEISSACEASPSIAQPWKPFHVLAEFAVVPERPIHWTRSSAAEHENTVRRQYHDCIQAYSRLRLTKSDEDKLLAFAGIAKRIGATSYYDDKYVAGIFLQDLPVDLVWTQVDFRQTKKSQELYRAPSWSWASVDGSVSTFYPWSEDSVSGRSTYPNLSTLAAVMDVLVVPADPNNIYGQLSSAHLVLLGVLIPCQISDLTLSHFRVAYKAQLQSLDSSMKDIGDFRPDIREGLSFDGVHFACPILDLEEEDPYRLRGIVLKKLDDVSYQRVGEFSMPHSWHEAKLLHNLDGLVEQKIKII